MSSEVRIVRPFVGVERFQAILDGWRVRIGPDEIASGEHATVGSSNYLGIKPVLVAGGDEEAVSSALKEARDAADELGFDHDQIEVLVVASTPFLRLADVAYRKPLSASDAIVQNAVLGADGGVMALQAPTGGCDIDVFFCLADHTESRPLAPSRKGTWLGRAHFSIRTELGELGFTPIPLDAQKRADLDLPEKTVRFVEVDPEDLMSEDLAEVVQLYVDDTLLAHLNQAPNSPAARSFQRQLYLDVMSAIVRAASRANGFDQLQLTDLDGTFVGRVVEAAANRQKGESTASFHDRCENALHLLKQKPEHFMAALEAKISPREDLKNAIGGAES